MAVRILQLTDLHLMSDRDATLRGIPTWNSFRDVMQFIRDGDFQFDMIVITGDLAHDEQPRTYDMLRDELSDYVESCRLLPGNHDDRQAMRNVFPELFSEPIESLVFSRRLGDWRVIGLDTQLPGEVAGNVTNTQVAWLDSQLKTAANEPTLVFMHHPPFSVESAWLDEIGLNSASSLMTLLTSHSNVRVICTGHVHHEFHRTVGKLECFTTPSCGVQFRPRSQETEYDFAAPGFRVFTLSENDFDTEVIRLPEVKYLPNPEDGNT